LWFLFYSQNKDHQGYAIQLMVVLIPFSSAIIAATAMRSTSTRQIDRLITGFLEKTLLTRFQAWTNQKNSNNLIGSTYPFESAKLQQSTQDRSYAYFDLTWKDSIHPPAFVGIKTNVFNFEIFTQLTLTISPPESPENTSETTLISSANLKEIAKHPLLRHFMGTLQGAVSEGYDIKVSLGPATPKADPKQTQILMHISMRQKLRENFLTSPFLKRYFAEDAVIAVGVLFTEWRDSKFSQKQSNEISS